MYATSPPIFCLRTHFSVLWGSFAPQACSSIQIHTPYHAANAVYAYGVVRNNRAQGFARAGDCAGIYSTRGEIVIDLRGTPFKVEGPSSCSAQGVGISAIVCSQWTATNKDPRVTLACSDINQRCVVRCGGDSGGCFLTKGYLQLAVHNTTQFQAVLEQQGRPGHATSVLHLHPTFSFLVHASVHATKWKRCVPIVPLQWHQPRPLRRR